jgi:hypothetical protein
LGLNDNDWFSAVVLGIKLIFKGTPSWMLTKMFRRQSSLKCYNFMEMLEDGVNL